MTNNKMTAGTYINFNRQAPTSAVKPLNTTAFSNKIQSNIIGFSNEKSLLETRSS